MPRHRIPLLQSSSTSCSAHSLSIASSMTTSKSINIKTITATSLIICSVCLIFLIDSSTSSSASLSSGGISLEGPNVCEKEEEFNVTTVVHQPIPFQVKTFVWCAKIPPRCPTTRTAYKTGWRNETKLTRKTIKLCCEGFAQVEGRCLPRQQQYLIINGSSSLMSETLKGLHEEAGSASNSIGIWAGICLTLLMVIAIFMLILFKYKKKLHQVKEELNYVTYTSDRSGSSVGSTGNASALYAQVNAHESSIPNNSVKHFVVNDLKSGQQCKESNLERAAVLKKEAALDADFPSILPSQVTADSSCAQPTGATAASYDIPDLPLPDLPAPPPKSFNPNIYHGSTSKEVDKEPIYEELKDPPPLPPALPPTTLERKHRNHLSPQPSISSSVYDMPRNSLSRSSSRASSVADNSINSSATYSMTPSPAKVATTTCKILNRLDETDDTFCLPSTSFRPNASACSDDGRRHRNQVDAEEDGEEEDRSMTEEKIYANDVNCHQKEI